MAVVGGLYALNEAVRSFETGGLGYYLLALYWLAVLVVLGRIPLMGMMIEPGGVRVRQELRNHHLRWDQIERFELTEESWGRMRVRLRDDGTIRVKGFFAQSASEKARRQALFEALEARREELGSQARPAAISTRSSAVAKR